MPFLKGKSIIVTLAVFILLIFLHFIDILNPVERAVFNAFAPAQEHLYKQSTKVGSFFEKFRKRATESEIELLKTQIRSLLVQNAKLKLMAEENKILKKNLGFQQEYEYELAGARIIGFSTLKNSTTAIIQIENKDFDYEKLLPGMPVVAGDGIFVGKILSIKENRVFVMPLISQGSTVAATILNNSKTIGVAEGELNLSIKMRMIPKSERIKQGDLVITSGLEEEIPQGLLIGTVSKVSEDPLSPFNLAHITTLYDIKQLSKVMVILNY